MKVSAVDLFCGAGGLTNGLEAAGISVEAGFDNDEDCEYAYEENNDAEFVHKNLAKVARDEPTLIGEYLDDDADATLIAACAPCQPFSPLNHGKESSDHAMYGLLSHLAAIIEVVDPDFVVMENVYEVRRAEVYEQFIDKVQNLGYNLNPRDDKRVYCPEYGIPQKRRRWVVTGSKEGRLDLGTPPITDESDYPTVKEAIGHLPKIKADGEHHPNDWLHTARELSEENLERVKQSKPGRTWRDWDDDLLLECHKQDSGSTFDSVYGRMEPDEPAPTITTQFYNLGSGRFGHYDTDQNRAISLREGALLQTFPEDYEFAAEYDDLGITKYGQLIGNAVPPDLGEIIGRRVLEFLRGEDRQTTITDY
ncbi:DNA (cytosine-5)-methyltransferase 1 [Halogeometricum rufum]|uniref:DNA (cytosine-5-)-methyltransferase n=1 Tax=Halogeometricum rufum TaxID=553469 RepID=A0A1I6HFR3_9EURY|nr:DNA cytosine methyltransferase [Halogeometricum rufum]SFR53342.1 DNA (cytosine-5)-methyltransferase 1 [Halogeometricum rufum]